MAILYKPMGYERLSKAAKSKLCNGCGAKGFGGYLVPDTMLGLSMTEACNIHDYEYSIGKTIAAKDKADRTFLNNCIRIIEQDGKQWGWLVKWRKQRAHEYDLAVQQFGGPAYWQGKN